MAGSSILQQSHHHFIAIVSSFYSNRIILQQSNHHFSTSRLSLYRSVLSFGGSCCISVPRHRSRWDGGIEPTNLKIHPMVWCVGRPSVGLHLYMSLSCSAWREDGYLLGSMLNHGSSLGSKSTGSPWNSVFWFHSFGSESVDSTW